MKWDGRSHGDAIAFPNPEGRAYENWKRMMQAGEEYLTSVHPVAHAHGQRASIARPWAFSGVEGLRGI